MKKRQYTLEEIRQRQDDLQAQLKKREESLTQAVRQLRKPAEKPRGLVGNVIARAQQMSFAVDAALLGYKLYRSLRGSKKISRKR